MKKYFAVVLAAMVALPTMLSAETNEELKEEIRALRQQLQALEQRMSAQDQKTDRLAASAALVEETRMQLEEDRMSLLESFAQMKAMNDAITISGNIDIVGYVADVDFRSEGEDTQDLYLDQLTLNIEAQINDYVTGVVELLFEEGSNVPFISGVGGSPVASSDTELTQNLWVYQAYIKIANPDGGMYTTIGRQYMPFGNYATNFILDTQAQQLGETRDTGIVLGYANEGMDIAIFGFNGQNEQFDDGDATNDNNTVDTWGASVTYSMEQEDMSMKMGVGYINNIYQAVNSNGAGTVSTFGQFLHEVDAVNGFVTMQSGPMWMSAEIVHAIRNTDNVGDAALTQGNSRQPSAYSVEMGFTLPIGEREYTLMGKYENNEESLDTTSIDYVWGVGAATELFTNTTLTLNYEVQRHGDRGTGFTPDTIDEEAGAHIYLAELSINF